MYMDSFAFYISALRKQFLAFCSQRFSALGITYGQLFVLIYIGKRNECSPKEISEFLKLDAGQLNRTLCKLTENGLITQRKAPHDRRVNIVSLTISGKRMFEESYNLFYEWDQLALSQISEKDRQHLMKLMHDILLKGKNEMEEYHHGKIKRFYEDSDREL